MEATSTMTSTASALAGATSVMVESTMAITLATTPMMATAKMEEEEDEG